MRPKGKLFALVVLFAAVGLLTATGAFTTVEAERTAEVSTTGDADALLGIEPAGQSEFATTSDGQVQIQLNDTATNNDPNPSGVNMNATTLDDNVLNITNNGQEDVVVQIDAPTQNSAKVYFYNASKTTNGLDGGSGTSLSDANLNATGNLDNSGNQRYVINTSNSGIQLTSGEQVQVGIYIDTFGVSNDVEIFDGDITITATDVDENP